MNRILTRILLLSSCSILFLAIFNIDAKSLNENTDELSFAILSDVHIDKDNDSKEIKLDRALGIINERMTNIDKYIFTGDYTNRGFITEYNLFNKIYYNNVSSKDKRIILMGNHDYWNELDIESSKKRFKNELNKELYYSEKVKGYTFISLSTENEFVEGYYSNKSLEFASREIEKSIKEDKSRPIFIFMHHPPKNTIYGSEYWGTNGVNECLSKYPQVILFAGHSHFPLNDERSIYQKDYTIVSAGAICGIGLEEGHVEGKTPSDAIKTSQGLIVKVDKNNKVIISRMDFLNNEEIKEPWIIDTFNKVNFKYTEERANNENPYFTVSSIAQINSRRGEKVNIIFTQGKDDDIVHSYKVELYEKEDDSLNGKYIEKKVQEHLMFSKFYLGSKIPKILDLTIENIDIGKEYILKIYAIDSFGNMSSTPLKCYIPKL